MRQAAVLCVQLEIYYKNVSNSIYPFIYSSVCVCVLCCVKEYIFALISERKKLAETRKSEMRALSARWRAVATLINSVGIFSTIYNGTAASDRITFLYIYIHTHTYTYMYTKYIRSEWTIICVSLLCVNNRTQTRVHKIKTEENHIGIKKKLANNKSIANIRYLNCCLWLLQNMRTHKPKQINCCYRNKKLEFFLPRRISRIITKDSQYILYFLI